jgi:hypothetical protein
MIETELDPDVALANPRKDATAARWALTTRHPDVGRVDPETFWLAFQAGVNWAMKHTARMSELLHTSAELILMLDRHECPSYCANCLEALNPPTKDNER